MTLTKADIVDHIQDHLGFPKNRSAELVETLLRTVKQNLADGEDLLISGFGKFCVKEKSRRRGRNPANGQDLLLNERRVVTFKCSGRLRREINGE